MPLVTVPLPKAHRFPGKVILMSKTSLPDARGVAVPEVEQLLLPAEMLPVLLIVTEMDWAFVFPVNPKPAKVPARLASEAG